MPLYVHHSLQVTHRPTGSGGLATMTQELRLSPELLNVDFKSEYKTDKHKDTADEATEG